MERKNKTNMKYQDNMQPQTLESLGMRIMKNGDKMQARKITQETLLRLSLYHAHKTQTWLPGSFILDQALENVQCAFEIRKYRKGGRTQQMPIPCPTERQKSIALRWILEAAQQKKKSEASFSLAQILYACFCREGKVFQRRNENNKIAEANRMSIR